MEYSDELVLSPNFMTSMYSRGYLRKKQRLKKGQKRIRFKTEDIPVVEIKKKRFYPEIFKKKGKILLDNARAGNGCTSCGTISLLQVHHIDEDIKNNEDSNLQVLCFYCHAKHHPHMQNRLPPKWLK